MLVVFENVQTPIAQCEQHEDGRCVRWKLDTTVRMELAQMLTFSLYFALPAKLHWRDVLYTGSLISNGEPCELEVDFEDGTLYAYYEARRRYDESYGGLVVHITRIELKLRIPHFLQIRDQFVASENHKVVALARHRKFGQVYMGRAQRICTTRYGGTRTLFWETNQQPALDGPFPGVPKREAQDWTKLVEAARDIETIKSGALLSPRAMEVLPYVPDHDDFHNQNYVLPIRFSKNDQLLQLQLFNLKHRPAPYVEYALRWGIIEHPPGAAGRRRSSGLLTTAVQTLTEQLTDLLELQLDYVWKSFKSVDIVGVRLVAYKYLFSLDNMGVGASPKSI